MFDHDIYNGRCGIPKHLNMLISQPHYPMLKIAPCACSIATQLVFQHSWVQVLQDCSQEIGQQAILLSCFTRQLCCVVYFRSEQIVKSINKISRRTSLNELPHFAMQVD